MREKITKEGNKTQGDDPFVFTEKTMLEARKAQTAKEDAYIAECRAMYRNATPEYRKRVAEGR